MKKRILSITLVLCMVLSLLPLTPITVASTSAGASGVPIYTYDDTTDTLTVSGTGTVTSEAVESAAGSKALCHLELGSGITKIGEDAFAGLQNLESVTILGSSVTILDHAFSDCSILGSVYFFGEELIFSDPSQTFAGCPNTLKLYGYTSAGVEGHIQAGLKVTFVPFNGSCGATESDNVTWKLSADGTMTISGTGEMADYSVTRLSGGILEDDRPWKVLVGMIKKSVIADGVTKVGKNAFARCANLTSATISNSVNTIGENAFYDCNGLNSVVILGSVSIIGKCAFYNCKGLNSVVILGSVNTIDQRAFWIDSGARKLNMYIMGSIQSIGLAAFSMHDDVGTTIPLTNFKIYKCNDSVEQAFEAAGYTTFTYSQSCFVITGGKWGTDYTYDLANGVLTVLTPTPLEIKNMDASTATAHRIVVASGVNANITLAGVNIDLSNTGEINVSSGVSAFLIENDSTGDVTITLADGTTNTLKSGISCAGIQKTGVSTATNTVGTLTIQGTGKLHASGGEGGAGIGAGYEGTKGTQNIVILGGIIEANGSAAGIGGAKNGNASYITIKGGNVTASGGEGGAGIGGGDYGTGSNITIENGDVTATGGISGAGIGGGSHGDATDIKIKNGTVIATGGKWAAGIGSGSGNNTDVKTGSNIVISGGDVTATGGDYGAGIGGGTWCTGSSITVSGGKVIATGKRNAAGIGGGNNGSGLNITIENGDVTANGGEDGAGIGSGINYNASYITISGGTVTATGGTRAAGIGGGSKGIGSDIKIKNGIVTATGGNYGAGIGGGTWNTGTNITISGGKVIATGKRNASGIGGGNNGNGSSITVSGGIVIATGGQCGAGIGGGIHYNGSDITVSGGTVTATGGARAAGIGGGGNDDDNDTKLAGDGSNVIISGGSVKVTGGTDANTIGGGAGKSAVTPTDGKGNDVFLLTISNPNGHAVIVDGQLYTPVNHTAADPTDTKLYMYSTQNVTAHTVTFNDGINTTTFHVVGKPGNNAPATPAVPTGYTSFDGWYTAQEGGTKFDFNNTVTADTTLYARFIPETYTVNYNAGANGTGTVAADSKTYGVALTLESNTFTRTGYIQTGWATTDGGEKVYDLGGSYTANTAVTLYPVWTINQYTVTVKPENGETDITITQDYGTTVTEPTLTRDGYEFDGWDKTFPTTMPAGSMTITAKWKDITAPTGEITLGTNRWNKLLNSITFGLFFKDTQEVTIIATDNSGEEVTVEYLLGDKELSSTELAAATFTAYTDKFAVEPNNEYVIYAKLTDKSGNVSYINSNRIVLDNVKPVISGAEDGKTYCAAQTVTVSEKYEVTVTVNDEPVTLTNGQFTLSAAEGEQKIVATDKAGNQTEMTVTVNNGHTGGTATCMRKAKCEACGEEYGEADNSNHDLENIKESIATVTETGNTEYWHCKDCDKYFSDKDGKNTIDLKDTVIGKLPPEIIDGKGQSLTEGETRELTFRSNAAFVDFIRVDLDGETVDGVNYTTKEGSTIVTLKAAYVAALSAGEHTLGIVSESGTAETAFTVNAKAVDTDSPQTGDNSHTTLWFALALLSGGALIGTAVYGKKKKRFTK